MIPIQTALETVVVTFTYVTNWFDAWPNLHLWFSYSPLGHLWTLAVEEHFYLVWTPAMLLLTRLRRGALVVTAALAMYFLIEPIWFVSGNFNRVYFGTDTRAGALFCGALVAWLWHEGAFRWLRRWRSAWVFGGAALLAFIVSAPQSGHGRDSWVTGLALASVGGALLVVYLVERPKGMAARLLSTPLLVAIGKRSYAIYLWSYVLNTWFRDAGPLAAPLVLSTTMLAAELSYRLVELPALRRKDLLIAARRHPEPASRPRPNLPPRQSQSPTGALPSR